MARKTKITSVKPKKKVTPTKIVKHKVLTLEDQPEIDSTPKPSSVLMKKEDAVSKIAESQGVELKEETKVSKKLFDDHPAGRIVHQMPEERGIPEEMRGPLRNLSIDTSDDVYDVRVLFPVHLYQLDESRVVYKFDNFPVFANKTHTILDDYSTFSLPYAMKDPSDVRSEAVFQELGLTSPTKTYDLTRLIGSAHKPNAAMVKKRKPKVVVDDSTSTDSTDAVVVSPSNDDDNVPADDNAPTDDIEFLPKGKTQKLPAGVLVEGVSMTPGVAEVLKLADKEHFYLLGFTFNHSLPKGSFVIVKVDPADGSSKKNVKTGLIARWNQARSVFEISIVQTVKKLNQALGVRNKNSEELLRLLKEHNQSEIMKALGISDE